MEPDVPGQKPPPSPKWGRHGIRTVESSCPRTKHSRRTLSLSPPRSTSARAWPPLFIILPTDARGDTDGYLGHGRKGDAGAQDRDGHCRGGADKKQHAARQGGEGEGTGEEMNQTQDIISSMRMAVEELAAALMRASVCEQVRSEEEAAARDACTRVCVDKDAEIKALKRRCRHLLVRYLSGASTPAAVSFRGLKSQCCLDVPRIPLPAPCSSLFVAVWCCETGRKGCAVAMTMMIMV